MAMQDGAQFIVVPGDSGAQAHKPIALMDSANTVAEVEIYALSTNTAIIRVGSWMVSVDPSFPLGVELSANHSVVFNNVDLSQIFITGTVDGEGVTWLAF